METKQDTNSDEPLNKKRGVLLLNMGGPDSLDAVEPFLYNLFSDRTIIKLGPSFMQKPIAFLISRLRADKSRHMYELIGGCSPIKEMTQMQADALGEVLESSGEEYSIYVGMRYWHPFIEDAIKAMYDDGIRQMAAISLYPHYSLATSGSSFIEMERVLKKYKMVCKTVKSWPLNKLYIEAMTELITQALNELPENSCTNILFSAHSLPEYFIKNGDPYVSELNITIKALKEAIGSHMNYHIAYQSKTSGSMKWLTPYTEEKIAEIAGKNNGKTILIVPISFVSDHIETLYEIDILYTELGKSLGVEIKRPQALNTHPTFINALKGLVEDTFQVISNLQ